MLQSQIRILIIGATRKTGGSNRGYKPPLLTRASRRGLLLCSSLSVIVTLAAPNMLHADPILSTILDRIQLTINLSRDVSTGMGIALKSAVHSKGYPKS
jgi:hypothetical protein